MSRLTLATIALAGMVAAVFGPAIGQEKSPAKRPAATRQEPTSLPGVIVAKRSVVKLDKEAVLASDRPGILEFVEPEEGDRVTAGQQVAGLKDEVAAAALAVAEKAAESDIETRYAQAAADVAKVEHRKSVEANKTARARGLDRDLIPEVEIERLRLAADRAVLQIEKADLDQQVADLERDVKAAELRTFQVVTPLDGVVTEVLKHPGEAVQQGDPILRIVKTDVVRVEGFVSVADAFRVKPGDRVTVRLSTTEIPGLPAELAERSFEGKVAFVDPTGTRVANLIRVWATVPNEDNLLMAGLPAVMEIRPSGTLAAALGRSETVE